MSKPARAQPAHRRRWLHAALAAGVAATVPPSLAQQRMRRLGVLVSQSGVEDVNDFLRRLAKSGWIEGKTLAIDRQATQRGESAIDNALGALMGARPDVILVSGTAAAIAARKRTTTVPIVFSMGADPVALGLVETLARPGGNATGVYTSQLPMEGKRLSLLRELMPGVERVTVLRDSTNAYWHLTRDSRDATYRSLGIAPEYIEVVSPDEIAGAVERSATRRSQAIMIDTDVFWYTHRDVLVRAAQRQRLPIVAGDPDLASAGALLSLSREEEETDRMMVEYVDRVLRGTPPSSLPVQEPNKFVLALNLATAKDLGINVPQGLLVRADRVIR